MLIKDGMVDYDINESVLNISHHLNPCPTTSMCDMHYQLSYAIKPYL